MKILLYYLLVLYTAGTLARPALLAQNEDRSPVGVLIEQKIACGPGSCLINFWQDLDGDGDADLVSLYVVPDEGPKRLIMREWIVRKGESAAL